jgi:signal transduction histidine kinase
MTISDDELLKELDKRFKECKNTLNEQKELARQLVLANKKLVESEALKTHFISNITNEIINPFASILGLSRNILMVREGDWDKVKNMARLIHSEAFSLDFQFRNIFEAANIEAGEVFVETSATDISELIRNALESFRHEAERKNIRTEVLDKLDSRTFISDPAKISLIISNLLSNAIKYTGENGKVTITLEYSGKELIITVNDTGLGINEESREEIFDRFKRLNDQINSINVGHGLGLSIIKSILELLNGTIEFKSEPGIGSEFTVKIPESESDTSIYGLSGDDSLGPDGNNEIF